MIFALLLKYKLDKMIIIKILMNIVSYANEDIFFQYFLTPKGIKLSN